MPKKKPAPKAEAPTDGFLDIAEIRFLVEYSSIVSPIRVHGLHHPDYHFFQAPDGPHFERRYVLGETNPEDGRFPLAQARADLDDLQDGTGLLRLRFRVKLFTRAEAQEAVKAVEAARKQALQDEENTRAELASVQQRRADLQAQEAALTGGDPNAIEALRQTPGTKPDALKALDELVGV